MKMFYLLVHLYAGEHFATQALARIELQDIGRFDDVLVKLREHNQVKDAAQVGIRFRPAEHEQFGFAAIRVMQIIPAEE